MDRHDKHRLTSAILEILQREEHTDFLAEQIDASKVEVTPIIDMPTALQVKVWPSHGPNTPVYFNLRLRELM